VLPLEQAIALLKDAAVAPDLKRPVGAAWRLGE